MAVKVRSVDNLSSLADAVTMVGRAARYYADYTLEDMPISGIETLLDLIAEELRAAAEEESRDALRRVVPVEAYRLEGFQVSYYFQLRAALEKHSI